MSGLDSEVPSQILDQLRILENALKENKKLSLDYHNLSIPQKYDELQSKTDKVKKYSRNLKKLIFQEQEKNTKLVDELHRDQKIAQRSVRINNINRKQPDYSRMHTVDYMHEVVSEFEQSIDKHKNMIQSLKNTLEQVQNAANGKENVFTGSQLLRHINRFDTIFSTVASQVYSIQEDIERLKDAHKDQYRHFIGSQEPHKTHKKYDKRMDQFLDLKGIDPFPTYNTILSLSEFFPKQAPIQQPFFNSSTSLFAPKTQAQSTFPPFSFTNPSNTSSTSLFGLKSTAASTPFSSITTTSSPFISSSSTIGASTGTTTQTGTLFSNTLGTPSAGTLFTNTPNTVFPK